MFFHLYMCCNVRYRSDNTPVDLKEPFKGQGQGQSCNKMAEIGIFLPVFGNFLLILVRISFNICF